MSTFVKSNYCQLVDQTCIKQMTLAYKTTGEVTVVLEAFCADSCSIISNAQNLQLAKKQEFSITYHYYSLP